MSSTENCIAVNGKSFANADKGGALRASLSIVRALHQHYQNHPDGKVLEVLIPTSQPISYLSLFQDKSIKIIYFLNPLYKYAFFRAAWEQFILYFHLKRHNKYKLLLNLTNTSPFLFPLNIPQVLLVHDVGFLNRQWFNLFFSKHLNLNINHAIKSKDIYLVTVSQSSARALLKEFPKMSPPTVIYHGHDTPPLKIQLQYYNRDYIIFIGSINSRKNLSRLLKAFSILKTKINRELKLVIIGSQKKIFKQKYILEPVDPDISYLGYVEEDVKWSLLRHAKLLILPSFLEGFGLPILEAFSVGTPVVASDIPVFRELYHNSIEYINPHDPDDIARGMKYILEFKNRRHTIIQNGYKALANFSWTKAADEYDSLINKILS